LSGGDSQPIYLDNAATTRVDERVLAAMLPFFTEKFANPSSREHGPGRKAGGAVEAAREQAAALIGARPGEIIFTSGATESINLALKGVAWAALGQGRPAHIVISAIEHNAVRDCCKALERHGVAITIVPVDGEGRVDPDTVSAALHADTVLISVMAANNEIGTVQPVAQIAQIARARGIPFHSDATQAAGKIPLDMAAGPDLLSFSAHKMHGPKGAGALYIRSTRPRLEITPLLHGGGQERDLRPGTLNVPAIVGFGAACDLAGTGMESDMARVAGLRELLERSLLEGCPGARINGAGAARLPGITSLTLPGTDRDLLLARLPELAMASGSACLSSQGKPSHVLRAIGLDDGAARATLRLSLGRFTSRDEIERAARLIGAEAAAQALSARRGAS